ncbi:MAG: Hpt domain-containing protein [Zoogloeaceae bacterium]|nr:Hpt domain-containing protein [Zoogloeaceae bacterium]
MEENAGFDIGPLAWVKGEIDGALEESSSALGKYQAEREGTHLKFARTHLQQANGALTMIGLDGATQLSEALDVVLAQVESSALISPDSAIEAAQSGIRELRRYLDGLLIGEPHQPLRLLPTYQRAMSALGKPKVNPVDLFFPDLSLRPPKRAVAPKISDDLRRKLVHAERAAYQKGLLIWLRAKEESAAREGLTKMKTALARIEAAQNSPSVRSFWWAALGLVTALLHGASRIGDARSLCARIDQQIRRLQQGNPGIAERLLRDCLYYVANTPEKADPLLKDIQSVYQLKRLIPDAKTAAHEDLAAQTADVRPLKDALSGANEQWSRYCAGSAAALPIFIERSKAVARHAAAVDAHMKTMADALVSSAEWLQQDSMRQTDAMLMEMATALILLQMTLETWPHVSEGFAGQVALIVKRLADCRAGRALDEGVAPMLDELTRRAQEKMLVAQVAREIQNNLLEVEQALDTFFRDREKRPAAADLEASLTQVAGALTILGQNEAVTYAQECQKEALAFARPDYMPDEEACEKIASRISVLSFFVDTLAGGEIRFPEFLRRLSAHQNAVEEEGEEGAEEGAEVDSVEQQIETRKIEMRALLAELRVHPNDEVLSEQLAMLLDNLQKDADLVADEDLLLQARAALTALRSSASEEEEESEDFVSTRIETVADALAALEEVQEPVAAPSSDTMKLVEAKEEELDAELLSIFLEEAKEVLDTIQSQYTQLRQQPHDTEALTTIRRSVHTLKGSGRMVGLRDLGEAAWSVEQTLNLWLRQEMLVTPELLALIGLTHQTFGVWVQALSDSAHENIPDAAPLIAQAEALRGEGGGPPPAAAGGASSAGGASAAKGSAAMSAASAALKSMSEATPVAATESREEASSVGFAAEEIPENLPEEKDLTPSAESPPIQLEEINFAEVETAQETAMLEQVIAEEIKAVPDALEMVLPAEEEISAPPLEGELSPEELEESAPEEAASESPDPEVEVEVESEAESLSPIEGLSISQGLYDIFCEEAETHLKSLQSFLEMFVDAPDMETPYAAGRAAHTLAGISGTVGIHSLNVLAHELELALLRRNESERRASLEGQEVIRQAIAMAEAMFAQVRGGKLPEEQPALVEALGALYPAKESAPAAEAAQTAAPLVSGEIAPAVAALTDAMEDPDLLGVFLEEAADILSNLYAQISTWRSLRQDEAAPAALARLLHTFKGGARMAGAMNLGEITHILESRLIALKDSGSVDDAALDELEIAFDSLAQTVDRYRAGDYSIPVLPGTPSFAPKEAPFAERAALPVALEEGSETREIPPVSEANSSEKPTEALSAVPDAVKASASDGMVEEPPLLRDELDEQLLPIFLEEAVDLLDGFQREISIWRQAPRDDAAPRALARLLHTFKGSARMAGAMNLGELTHVTETRVSDLMQSSSASDADLDEIAAVCDTLSEIVERYRAGDYGAYAKTVTPVVPDPPEKTEDRPAAQVVSVPGIAAEAGTPVTTPVAAHGVSPEAEGAAQLRVRADLVDQLVNEAGELSIARARIEGEMRELKGSLVELTENVIRLRRQLREIEIQAETQIQAHTGTDAKADFDPLELDRFTRFQELTRMMAESVNDVATVQQNLLKSLDDADAAIAAQSRLNRSLQQSLMGVRMVPFYSQNERLYRLVRQTSRELGKRVNLDIYGGQVEMDRSVLEKILSPLEHMLRNSIAHGVEAREDRLKAGKPEVGEIRLTLTQEGNEIILTLADDGSGLDIAKIRGKAESSGLILSGQEVSDQDLLNFIFASGFSTASNVSRVAGRGVGMDVVKTEITALGGRIEILNEPGKGAAFRLYLPLTLAVTHVVLINAGGKLLAIPSVMVEQVLELQESRIADMREKGEVMWHGNRYPFYYLPRLFGDENSVVEERRLYWVMLLRSGTQRVAVLIDEIHGNQEVVVKNVGQQMARVVGIAGATVLGDGKIVLILNPVALATRMTALLGRRAVVERTETETQAEKPVVEAARRPTVMVVDDSLTVRKITSKLLTREGYQVVLAKDGVDAMEQLLEVVPDVILSDIEMPRMDGFDLARNIRADERLINVPLVMITSRTADKHRSLAMEIGANYYLGKPYNEEELLGILEKHTH